MTPKNTFLQKLFRALRNPLLLPLKIRNQVRFLYLVYVERDEFSMAAKKWFADHGDEKLRFDYPLGPDSIVFDLGGYRGEFADAINKRFGCQVYLFEPVKRFYDECVARFEGNAKVRCFNYGLSDSNGSFLISDEEDASSLTKADSAKASVEVFVKSFAEEVTALGVERIDLLKMNVEGAEFMILPHILSSGLAPRIDNFQIQFHDFYPNAKPLREEIRRRLAETHRELWNYPFVWESWTRKK
ncbi:MAG: FkbM family methyltransferase [Moraxellaceae bacterium]|jgi:FkbM family methyltransferase|nr:FkbM family methyltransferase [Moraxellaceae bacterium]